MTTKDRYEGIQTILKTCGEEGCHFLSLLSIAEEEEKTYIDLIMAIRMFRSKGWLTPDFFVTDAIKILNFLTSKEWTREEVTKLPKEIAANQYTEVCYYNEKTSFRHFRRRYFDTLENSNTVKNGKIEKYYIYTCKG